MIGIKNYKTDEICKNDFQVCGASALANPYGFFPTKRVKFLVSSRGEAIEQFKQYLEKSVADRIPKICNELNRILIKKFLGEEFSLVCACRPNSCHAEIIKDWVDSQKYCLNWFSNMALLDEPIIYRGVKYWSVENFYQSCKVPKNDLETRNYIARLSPQKSKSYARNNNLSYSSDSLKLQAMEFALRRKFSQPKWKERLLSCEEEAVEYNNWKDSYWGVDIFTGKGKNHLGQIIQKIKLDILDKTC